MCNIFFLSIPSTYRGVHIGECWVWYCYKKQIVVWGLGSVGSKHETPAPDMVVHIVFPTLRSRGESINVQCYTVSLLPAWDTWDTVLKTFLHLRIFQANLWVRGLPSHHKEFKDNQGFIMRPCLKMNEWMNEWMSK